VSRALALPLLVLAACGSGVDTRGTALRCETIAIPLEVGESVTVALPAARAPGTCARGDRAAEVVLDVGLRRAERDTIVRAISDRGDPLVLSAMRACGEATTLAACDDRVGADGSTELVIGAEALPDARTFVHLRSKSGDASMVTVEIAGREVQRLGEECDSGATSPPCPDGPGCVLSSRCALGLACSAGRCVPSVSSLGGACLDGVQCSVGIACHEGRCVELIGAPCDAPPTFCSESFGVTCVDGTCRSQSAPLGARCRLDRAPFCEPPLTCDGEEGAEICVDLLGTVCERDMPLVLGTVAAPVAPVLSPAFDPDAPSRHQTACEGGEGGSTPEQVWTLPVSFATRTARVIARPLDPETEAPLVYVRGPGSCAIFVESCASRGEARFWASAGPTDPVFVIVEGPNEYDIQAFEYDALPVGASCADSTDPFSACSPGTSCLGDRCVTPTFVGDGSTCFCRPLGGLDLTTTSLLVRGMLGGGTAQWFQAFDLGATPLRALRFEPRGECPPDLRVEVIDGSVVPCRAECDPSPLPAPIAAATLGADGTCIARELPLAAARSRADLRFSLRSASGGPIALDVYGLP
jgi:hypothetical protein